MCGILCCFGCLSLCGCRDIVCRKLVFFPPRPNYEAAPLEPSPPQTSDGLVADATENGAIVENSTPSVSSKHSRSPSPSRSRSQSAASAREHGTGTAAAKVKSKRPSSARAASKSGVTSSNIEMQELEHRRSASEHIIGGTGTGSTNHERKSSSGTDANTSGSSKKSAAAKKSSKGARTNGELTVKATDTKMYMWVLNDDYERVRPLSKSNFHFAFIPIGRSQRLASFFIQQPGSRFVLHFSHGNATDLGWMREHLVDLSEQLEVSVFAYDYQGYGLSTGKASASRVYRDAEQSFQFLQKKWGVQESDVIAYGQSLGSAPAIRLSSDHKLGGCVLHSPLTSGLRVIRDVKKTHWFDIFPNVDEVPKVQCPVFVIHGTADREIPADHGEALAAAVPDPYQPWFVEGAGHNNIEVNLRSKYFHKLRVFLAAMGQRESNHNHDDAASAGG